MVQKVNFNVLTGDELTVGNTVITGTGVTVSGAPLTGGSGGAEVYANSSLFPLTDLTPGSFAFANNNNTLYITNGAGWYKIALINQSPTITASIETATLGNSGNTVIFTYSTTEPEGTPVSVTLSNSGISNTSVANVVHYTSNNTIEFNNFSGDEYSATLTLTATDGVNIGTDSVTFSIQYVNLYWIRTSTNVYPWTYDSSDYSAYMQWTDSESGFGFGADTNTNVHVVSKIDGSTQEYAWSTYLQADMNNYNQSHSGQYVVTANGAPIALMENPEIIGGQQRTSPMFFRLNPTTGAVEKGLSIPFGIGPSQYSGAGQSSVDSGSIWWMGNRGTSSAGIGAARIPWSMYTSGDTINTGNNHWYKTYNISTGGSWPWYDGGSPSIHSTELTDGCLITTGYTYRSSGSPNYYIGFYSHIIKLNNDGSYNSTLYNQPTLSYTSASNGWNPTDIASNQNDMILVGGGDSRSGYTYRAQFALIDASGTNMSVTAYKCFSPSGYTSSSASWVARQIDVDESGNFIVWLHSTFYDKIYVIKLSGTDLSQVGDGYLYNGTFAAGPSYGKVPQPTGYKTYQAHISAGTPTAWNGSTSEMPPSNSTDAMGNASVVAITDWGTGHTMSFNLATSGLTVGNSWTPTDIYGNHPTTYGGNANYFNVITTSYDISSWQTVTSNSDFTLI